MKPNSPLLGLRCQSRHQLLRVGVVQLFQDFRRQLDETLRFASVTAADRVLEIGCGMGRGTLLLAERGVRVEGLDLSQALLDRLRAYNRGRFHIPIHCADVLKRWSDERFHALEC